ncbi:MAG TPA: hypothetical protein VK030_01800 [Actinomycetales bacterium]|nr:hypothetical protein [Actinomycetales bacterium]
MMARLQKLFRTLRRRPTASRVGLRRRTLAQPPKDWGREDELRAILVEDPNDIAAFNELVDLVRTRIREAQEHEWHVDNLRGDVPEDPRDAAERAANDAVWALSEELAGNPRAWHPLIELARLSIHEDRDGAMRRLTTAVERDHSGVALAEGIKTLREVDAPADALALGVGHWRPKEHTPEAGKQLIKAAIEAGRLAEAKRHFEALAEHPDTGYVGRVRAELEGLLGD